MKFILPLLIMFSINGLANDISRPSSNNKIGHSKQSAQSKENSFFYKLFNDELDGYSKSSIDNDKILSQIERLANFREKGIISEEEFQNKKLLLLEKIR